MTGSRDEGRVQAAKGENGKGRTGGIQRMVGQERGKGVELAPRSALIAREHVG